MNWKRSLVGVVVAVTLLALLARGMGGNPAEIPSPLPGRPAPDFTLETMPRAEFTADTVSLEDLRGDVVVLNFWASWCLACRDEHAALSRVAEMYEGRGVHFFGVLYNDVAPNAVRWIDEMGGQSYATLLDPKSRTAIDFGLYGVPETFFIAPDGRVTHKQIGPVTEEILVQRIEQALGDGAERSRQAEPAPGDVR